MKLRIFFFFLISIIACRSVNAQWKGFSFGPYLEAAWTKGDFAQTHRNGVGIGLSADIKLGGKLAATGSVGYQYFGSRPAPVTEIERIKAIPIRVGVKYKLPLVYLKLESGTVKYNNNQGNALIVSPGVGIRLLGLDIMGSYESWLGEEGRSFAALRFAYHF